MLMLVFSFAFAQAPPIESIEEIEKTTSVSLDTVQAFTITDVVNSVLRSLTMTPDVAINLPSSFGLDTLASWWGIWLGFFMPLGLYLFHLFWPSSKKAHLVLKSTATALFVIAAIILIKGVSFPIIVNALIALLMKTWSYNGFWKYATGKSARLPIYSKE